MIIHRLAKIVLSLIALTLIRVTSGELTNMETQLILKIGRQNQDCIILAVSLSWSVLNVLQENIQNPLEIVGSPFNFSLKKFRCLIAVIDGKSRANLELAGIFAELTKIVDKEVFIFLHHMRELPVLYTGNLNYLLQDSFGRLHHYVHGFDQALRLITVLPGLEPSQFHFGHQCDSKSLRDKTLNISYAIVFPMTGVTEKGELFGVDIAIMKMASKYLRFIPNFKYEDTWYSRNNETDEPGGLLGSVSAGSSHLGIGSTVIGYTGLPNINLDFCWPLYATDLIFVASSPKPLKPIFNILRPFTGSIWILLLIALFCAVSLVYLILTMTKNHYKRGQSQTDLAFWSCMIPSGSLLGQAILKERPKQMPLSVFITFWLITSSWLHYCYDCNLRAYLMEVDFTKPIDNVEDVLATNTSVFLQMGTGVPQAFQGSSISSYREVYERSVQGNTIYDMKYTLAYEEKIVHEGGAKLVTKMIAPMVADRIHKNHGPFQVRLGKDAVFSTHGTFLVTPSMPWKDTLHLFLGKVVQAGVVYKEYQKEVSTLLQRVESRQDSAPEAFNMDHFVAGFILLAGGILLPLVILISEWIFSGGANQRWAKSQMSVSLQNMKRNLRKNVSTPECCAPKGHPAIRQPQ